MIQQTFGIADESYKILQYKQKSLILDTSANKKLNFIADKAVDANKKQDTATDKALDADKK